MSGRPAMMGARTWERALTCCAVLLTGAALAAAQPAPIPSRAAAAPLDSGLVSNPGDELAPVFTGEVRVPDAGWLRLRFDEVVLSGDTGAGTGAFLVLTSVLDGARQRLDAEAVRQWSSTSAYFNGDAVLVELWAYPETGASRLVMSEVTAGEGSAGGPDNVCGPSDERLPSNHPWTARLMPVGCTAYLVSHGRCANQFLTAGHCIDRGGLGVVAQFNVPFSEPNGAINHPPPEYQYPVEVGSVQTTGGALVGHDAATFMTAVNPNTGRGPAVAQRGAFDLASAAPAAAGQELRIYGYAVRRNNHVPIPFEWNQTQKTSTGPYVMKDGTILNYQVDTEAGNSGSPVILEATGEVIGIHTHGGCSPLGTGANRGTTIEHATLQAFLASPTGTCITYFEPHCVDTTLAGGGEGAIGGAVYFDLRPRLTHVEIWGLDLNLGESSQRGATFTVKLYTTPDGHAGKETSPALWTLAGRGVGIVEPEGRPSRMLLEEPVRLQYASTYGVALVLEGAAHAYTEGSAQFIDDRVMLDLGSATDAPFAGPVMAGRTWNGAICYDPERGCYADCDINGALDIFDFLCFQDFFVARHPYGNCDGNTVFDLFDFLCFQDSLVAGCP